MYGQIYCAQAAINGGLGFAVTQRAVAARDALLAAMTVQPSLRRSMLILNTISQLVQYGLWDQIDAWYEMRAHDSQAATLNWKNPGTWTLAPTNSPVFTADRGFKGDGVSSFLLATGYNPGVGSINFQLNTASYGVWVAQSPTIGSTRMLSMASNAFIGTVVAGNGFTGRLNDTSGGQWAPLSLALGHWCARRPDSAGFDKWKDGALYTAKDTSAAVSRGGNFSLLANANLSAFCDAQISLAWTAGGLVDADMVNIDKVARFYARGVLQI